MRIGIDARFYGSLGKGLGRYASELIAQLEQLDQENDYFIFLRRANFDEYQPANPRFHKILADIPWYGWREQMLMPLVLNRHRLDLMHFTHFNVPILYRRPFVVTVHDLILLSHPTPRASTWSPLVYRLKHWVYRRVIGHALRQARLVLTVSEFTKNEIKKHFPFTALQKIKVTYGACSPTFLEAAASSDQPVARAPKPYFLYVGNAYPHKNLRRLIAAFQKFRQGGHPDFTLVLVGGSDYFYDRLENETKAAGQQENVVFYGQATDQELTRLYDHAHAYVFASLCEGFGLPPLEAMSRNVPVASSQATCLPEILGDAALYFEPRDEMSLVEALTRLATDEQLRQELRDKGRERAARYDWKRSAAATLAGYRQAAAGCQD